MLAMNKMLCQHFFFLMIPWSWDL